MTQKQQHTLDAVTSDILDISFIGKGLWKFKLCFEPGRGGDSESAIATPSVYFVDKRYWRSGNSPLMSASKGSKGQQTA